MSELKLVVENVMQCTFCGGAVDRFEFHFECRSCGAYGDLNTGIMQKDDLRGVKK
jgi:hypothetical protein